MKQMVVQKLLLSLVDESSMVDSLVVILVEMISHQT